MNLSILDAKNSREELDLLSVELGLKQKAYLSIESADKLKRSLESGESLPVGVYLDANGYYGYIKTLLNDEEIDQLLAYRQTFYLKTIKNCVLFFAALTAISLIVSIIGIL